MRVVVYPADPYGCGHYRMMFPAEAARSQGLDVQVSPVYEGAGIRVTFKGNQPTGFQIPTGADVVVMQRIVTPEMVWVIRNLRANGIAVVLDIDDDLSAISPDNAAYHTMHPTSGTGMNWRLLGDAAREATLVTVSAERLAGVYAPHGRVRVLPNCVPARYLDLPRQDSDMLGWGGSISVHPDDLQVVGTSVARLQAEGTWFAVIGPINGVADALRLDLGRLGATGTVSILDWPAALSRLGVGIAPLADTRFNQSKSFLKILEMSAVGVPWVASPRAEYRRLHAQGAGLLADKPKHWYRQLSTLLRDPGRRAELSQAGREVAATLTYERCGWRWAEAWTDAYYLQKSTGV